MIASAVTLQSNGYNVRPNGKATSRLRSSDSTLQQNKPNNHDVHRRTAWGIYKWTINPPSPVTSGLPGGVPVGLAHLCQPEATPAGTPGARGVLLYLGGSVGFPARGVRSAGPQPGAAGGPVGQKEGLPRAAQRRGALCSADAHQGGAGARGAAPRRLNRPRQGGRNGTKKPRFWRGFSITGCQYVTGARC